jgi:hypothetical protein
VTFWYWIPLAMGFGVAFGAVVAGALAASRAGVVAALVVAAAAGVGIGFLIDDWRTAVGGALGGLAGAFGTSQLVLGSLRRGGTRGGTATLIAVGALALGVLALVPLVGYVEAVAVPLLGLRLRQRGGERYAGLRILARD